MFIHIAEVVMENEVCRTRVIHLDKVDRAKKQSLPDSEIFGMVRTLKALSDPGRVRIIIALLQEEMCVCDLAALLNGSESAVSHQLRHLRTAGLVKNRREGTVLYYRVCTDHVARLVKVVKELNEALHSGSCNLK